MKKIGKKLTSKRGETLVEILVAILIIALSAGLFASMYSASTRINLSAQQEDELLYEAVGTLEQLTESENTNKSPGKLQYKYKDENGVDKTEEVTVEYLTQDGLSVYRDKEE